MTNFDLMLSEMADDNVCTRRDVELLIGSYIYEITEVTEGSEKQIKWAVDIQMGAVKVIAKLAKMAEEEGITETFMLILDYVVENIFTHTAAKWYIDNRDNLNDYKMILKNFAVKRYQIVKYSYCYAGNVTYDFAIFDRYAYKEIASGFKNEKDALCWYSESGLDISEMEDKIRREYIGNAGMYA